mmetsp:Transcript_32204/g.83681  ORF Transcript_32204/g.83681 Transcript_32204/m.83681 type:complete len:144 (-) Transcript_32204:437-868(-)
MQWSGRSSMQSRTQYQSRCCPRSAISIFLCPSLHSLTFPSTSIFFQFGIATPIRLPPVSKKHLGSGGEDGGSKERLPLCLQATPAKACAASIGGCQQVSFVKLLLVEHNTEQVRCVAGKHITSKKVCVREGCYVTYFYSPSSS